MVSRTIPSPPSLPPRKCCLTGTAVRQPLHAQLLLQLLLLLRFPTGSWGQQCSISHYSLNKEINVICISTRILAYIFPGVVRFYSAIDRIICYFSINYWKVFLKNNSPYEYYLRKIHYKILILSTLDILCVLLSSTRM